MSEKYAANTVSAQVHRAGRVEEFHGDLDQHYANDHMESLIATFRYSTEDARRNRPNPTRIPIEGDIRTNLASYRDAIERYRRFRESHIDMPDQAGVRSSAMADVAEEAGQRISLERDMQAALRIAIDQLDPGLTIIDDGAERSVESGFIDITARDQAGAVVVIELKAGVAGQRAIAQILSYMGDVAIEEAGTPIRGILVASEFDAKAKSAARVVPNLLLRRYSVRFSFSDAYA